MPHVRPVQVPCATVLDLIFASHVAHRWHIGTTMCDAAKPLKSTARCGRSSHVTLLSRGLRKV